MPGRVGLCLRVSTKDGQTVDNRTAFHSPDLRRALALALDRKSFIEIFRRRAGRHRRGDAAAAGLGLSMPPDILATIPSHGPDKRLAIVAARNIAGYRDPVIILIDQLKEIGIDGELDRSRHRQAIAGGRRAPDHLPHRAATCMQPQVKGLTIMVNSHYNGWRMEDVWLDR